MRKLLAICLCLILCCSFSACLMLDTDEPRKEQGSGETPSGSKDETYGLNDSAVFKDLKFTANEIKESDGDTFLEPDAGKVYVGVKFTVENISDEEQSVSSLLLFEAYADDVKCDYSFGAMSAFGDGTLDGSIQPGKKLVGWYAVEVSQDWKTIEIQIQPSWLSSNPANFVFTK